MTVLSVDLGYLIAGAWVEGIGLAMLAMIAFGRVGRRIDHQTQRDYDNHIRRNR